MDETIFSGGTVVRALRAFQDNYIWLIEHAGHAVVVDPGDAAPVTRALRERSLTLDAIVVTHHHADHVGGVDALALATGAPVFLPRTCPHPTPPGRADTRLREGDSVTLLGSAYRVLEIPGHTLDHIGYWSESLGAVFCGDTLFACGCGRLFEGTPAQMHASLSRLAALPPATRAFCAHEYTSGNIRFARAVEPDSAALAQRAAQCAQARERDEPTVPSTIALERATNPFLRCAEPTVRAGLAQHGGAPAADDVAVFAGLRAWKDHF